MSIFIGFRPFVEYVLFGDKSIQYGILLKEKGEDNESTMMARC